MSTEARIQAIIEKATSKLLDPNRIVAIAPAAARLVALDAAGRLWIRFVEQTGWHRLETPYEEDQRHVAEERRQAYNANRRAKRKKIRS